MNTTKFRMHSNYVVSHPPKRNSTFELLRKNTSINWMYIFIDCVRHDVTDCLFGRIQETKPKHNSYRSRTKTYSLIASRTVCAKIHERYCGCFCCYCGCFCFLASSTSFKCQLLSAFIFYIVDYSKNSFSFCISSLLKFVYK